MPLFNPLQKSTHFPLHLIFIPCVCSVFRAPVILLARTVLLLRKFKNKGKMNKPDFSNCSTRKNNIRLFLELGGGHYRIYSHNLTNKTTWEPDK